MDVSELEAVEGPFPTPAAQIEAYQTHMNPTALGSGARVLNAYPLVHSQGVYEGLRAAAPDKRVLILTRSGFAGMQRYAAASWSGDISSTWTAMRKQIAAGLGFALSGMPYWTFDTGGFSVPDRFAHAPRGSAALDEWRELGDALVRVRRIRPDPARPRPGAQARDVGVRRRRQPGLPGDAEVRSAPLPAAAVRLFAGRGGHARGRNDHAPARDGFRPAPAPPPSDDQYMFGPALMVSPVTEYKARDARRYLRRRRAAGTTSGPARRRRRSRVTAPAPFDAIPVHVRAGAIIPFGPELQYTDEKPADPITLYVYAGSDGAFTLYEDDGVSNGYEKGAFATIPLRWQDATRTLTIGKRAGDLPRHARPPHLPGGARSARPPGAVLLHSQARAGRSVMRVRRSR